MEPIVDGALETNRERLTRACAKGVFHGRVKYLWAIYFLIAMDSAFGLSALLSVSREMTLSLFTIIVLLPMAGLTSVLIEIVRAFVVDYEMDGY